MNIGTLLDLISIFFGVFYLFDLNVPLLKYLTFITLYRGFKMTTYIGRIEEHFQFDRVVTGLLKLLRLVLFIYIVAHVGGCIFYLIGVSQNSTQVLTWLRLYANTYTSVVDVYILAVYWSFTTMITVGYGDITPQNVYEQIYTIIMMAMAGGVFGYSLNTIGQVVDEVTEATATSREKIRQITKYMKRKRLSRAVQMRVRKYLEYILEGEMIHREEEEKLLGMLSDQLKDEIVAEIHVKALMDLSVLSLSFTQRFLTVLARNLKEFTLSPDQVIFKDGDSSDHAIYYVTAGNVHIYLDRCGKIIKTLGRGEFFGEISFFSNRERTAAARSLNFSSVFELKREDFLAVVQDFPTDKETFYNIQDKILFEKDFSILGINCFNCQGIGHISLNCPKGHFFVSEQDNKEAFRAFIESGKKFRASFCRKEPRRSNPRLCLEKLTNDSIKIRADIPNIESLPIQGIYDEYDNLSDSSFEEVLDRKIYGKKPKDAPNTEPAIDSLDSVEGQHNIGSLKIHREWSQRDSIYPFQPPGSKGIFTGTLANINSHPLPHLQGSAADGNSADRKSHQVFGSMHFQSTHFKAIVVGNLFDTVYNYESYYTHGNINVLSQKINLTAMERLIHRNFEKRGKISVNRNTLKAIDILSRGSVFGSLRRESSDAIQSKEKLAKKKTNELPTLTANPELIANRLGSVLYQGSGFLVPGSAELPNRRLSLFNTNSRHGSVLANQDNSAPEFSMISNGSYQTELAGHEETVSPVLKPSRFSYLKAENKNSPTKKQELGSGQILQADNTQENQPKAVFSGGLSVKSSGYTLGQPSNSSLKMRRNSGSKDDKSSSENLKNNQVYPPRLPQRQDSSRTESNNEHTVLGDVNSNLTFQQKNSDDAASSYHHESKVEILKHLWNAMEVISKRNLGKSSKKSGKFRHRRSNSVGTQAKTEKLLDEFGLKEVLNEFLKLSSNKDLFMKDDIL